MKLNRFFGALLIIVVVVAVGVVIVFEQLNQQQNSFSPSTAILELPAPSYIDNSSIYLLSAKPYYGNYHGTPVFMINVIIRNDYTPENPPPDAPPNETSGFGSGEVNVIFTAHLYSKTAQINSYMYLGNGEEPGDYDLTLSSGQTTTWSIYMVTSQRDVENYTLAFEWLSAIPKL